MRAEFERARRDCERLTAEHQKHLSRLQELRGRLTAAGVSTRDLAGEERRLRSDIERTNGSLREQQRDLQRVSDRTRRFADARDRFSRVQGTATGLAAGGAAAIGTGMAVASPLAGAAEEAMQFESVMTDINQKVNQSREAGRLMGLDLRKAALAANQMPADLQKGVDTLTGFGLGARQAVDMMAPIGRAATAYKAEIDDLGKATFSAHDNLKVPIEQTGKALDVMAAAGKRGAFEVKDMAQHFPELSASLQSLGGKGVPAVADLAAALQITRKGAGDSASAATNLQNLLSKINAGDTIKNFKKFGIDVPAAMKKAAKDGRSPIEEIVRLTQKATGGDQAKLSALFGDMQVQQALRPLMSAFAEYQSIRQEALAANGTVNADFAERMNDSAQKVQRLKIRAKELALTVGTSLLPMVASAADRFAKWGEKLSAFAERHPTLIKAIAVATGVLAALFLVLGAGSILLAGLVAPIAVLGAAATALGIGLLPLIGIAAAVIVGIGALVAAGYWLYENWGNWPKILQGIFAAMKFTFMAFNPLGMLIRTFTPALNYLRSLNFAEIGRNLIQGLIGGITSKLAALKSTVVGVASSVSSWFKQKLGIHSPSRVFAGLGGFVMAGLDQGLAANTAGPLARITDLAGQMTRALAVGAGGAVMASAVSAPAAAGARAPAAAQGAGPRAGDTYNLHFHGMGADPREIEDAIRRAMEQIEREKQAREFRDGDY
jgi:TP901 family phage tail tape measure protein